MKKPKWVKWLDPKTTPRQNTTVLPVFNPITREWIISNPSDHEESVVVSEREYDRYRPKIGFNTRYGSI